MKSSVPLPNSESCLFLDVDGTLIEFSTIPSQTAASRSLKDLLLILSEVLEGAVALVSGRRIVDLDRIFFPLRLPAAGVHGGERRDVRDTNPIPLLPDARLDTLRARMRIFAQRHAGVVFEDKSIACAIHFRANVAAGAALQEALQPLLLDLGPEFHALHGNMVFEVKPRRFTKAGAIEEFLRRSPFKERTPIFLGDDTTDLDGFGLIESRNGISIAVGDRVPAQWRLPNPAAARDWLSEFAAMSTP